MKATGKIEKKRKKRNWNLFFLILPFMVYLFIFNIVPLWGWVLAFFDYRPGVPFFQNTFVGMDNFVYFLTSKYTLQALRNTLTFSAIGIATSFLPMLFAILLNEIDNVNFKRVVQTISTFPNFISWVIIYALVWFFFSNNGLVNELLMPFGITQTILIDKNAVYWFQTVIGMWKGLGWASIIYIAAITNIDPELYDAAAVDGAGHFRRAWHITVPCLWPTYLVLFLMGFAGILNTGTDQHLIFSNSLILDTIETIDLYVYRVGLLGQEYSFGIAVGILKSAVSISLIFFFNAIARKVRGESML